ncbi:MAG TPA: tripartite tricarboxylate transporter substrate binding protein [Roseomonas sp.]
MTRRSLAALGAALPLAARAQGAADFPRQAIRMVVPFAPGGATDILARILTPGMSERLGGRGVVIENRGGAAGVLGAEAVVSAAADGYTLAFFSITNSVLNAGLIRNARLDPRTAFMPVSLVATLPMVLTVGNHVPARTLPELIDLMRARPGQLTYGSSGTGGINHLGAHLLNMRTNTQAVHVPYRGAGLVYADMMAGNVDFLIEGIASQAPFVKSGQIQGLATLDRRRNPLLPDLPTAIEQGLEDFEIMNFMSVFARTGTPAPVIEKLEGAIRGAVRDEAAAQRYRDNGAEPVGSGGEEFRTFWQQQLALWLPVVEASGVRIE